MSIERIEKLIALSGSANEHEARSAAYLACKMIREGKYRIVDAAASGEWVDPFAAWASAVQQARRPERPRRPPPDTRPRRRVPCEIGTARRSGQCAVCSEAYEEGSDVAFPILANDAKIGVAHADCRSRWTVVDES